MIGPDRELFLKGRRCENQSLGIAAFTYYRRVVEDRKGRLIDSIQGAAERLNASSDLLQDLEKAAKETQFTTAIDQIIHAVPPSLLTQTHSAYSEPKAVELYRPNYAV